MAGGHGICGVEAEDKASNVYLENLAFPVGNGKYWRFLSRGVYDLCDYMS